MLTDILFPKDSKLVIDSIEIADPIVVISVKSTEEKGICPHCQTPSIRIHSCYQRHPADLPLAGVEVQLSLTVRRFFCDNRKCNKTTGISTIFVPISKNVGVEAENTFTPKWIRAPIAVAGPLFLMRTVRCFDFAVHGYLYRRICWFRRLSH